MGERAFQNLFGLMFLVFILGQFINARRSLQRAGEFEIREKFPLAMQLFRKTIGIVWFGSILSFFLKPEFVNWAAFPLPGWLRWVGFGIWAIFMPVLWWIEVTLGANFNTSLHLRSEHTLETSGPYRYIRHPMYGAMLPLLLSWLLASANWLVGLPGLIGGLVIFIVRIPQEEKVMRERFGEEYQEYVLRTGRLLPRIGRS